MTTGVGTPEVSGERPVEAPRRGRGDGGGRDRGGGRLGRDVGVEGIIAQRAFRQVRLGAVAWAVAFGATVASSAVTYVSSFPTEASRLQIAASTAKDAGISVLLGPISSIQTVGGYTVYKCFVALTTTGAIWAIRTATRLLRGEEESGRWQLVLAGATRASRATAATLAGLGGAIAIVFCGTTLFTLLAGQKSGVGFSAPDSVLYGLSITIAPAVFAGVGAVTSQVARTRRLASELAMAVFGLAFVLRMLADSSSSTRWLRWATPFGWTELMRPFTDNDPWPLVPAAATVIVLCAASVVLAARRDAGGGLLAPRDTAAVRPYGLRSPLGLASRLELPALAAWWAGVALAAFCLGIIGKIATGSVPASFTSTLKKFGVHGSLGNEYLGVAFLLMAVMVALLSAGQIGAAADEETSGRLSQVLAQPATRTKVFAGRLGLIAASVVLAGVVSGPLAWVGAASQGTALPAGPLLRAGLNVVPTALVALGIGAVVLAVVPSLAARVVYAVVVWSIVIDLLGSLVANLGWLERLSLFHYMALVPSQTARPLTLTINVVVAVVLWAVAIAVFDRRDLQS